MLKQRLPHYLYALPAQFNYDGRRQDTVQLPMHNLVTTFFKRPAVGHTHVLQ